jgi:hypothetical protein
MPLDMGPMTAGFHYDALERIRRGLGTGSCSRKCLTICQREAGTLPCLLMGCLAQRGPQNKR